MSEWKEIELGQVADVRGGKRLPKGEALSEFPTNHPYIRTRDIANHKIKINELLFVPDDIFSSISNYTVEENDLIISIVGTIGLCAVIPKELHLASLTENCAKIVNINNKQINRTFLFYYLISEEGQAEIESRSVGSTQPKLPLYNIKSIKIPVPPLPEQRAIASVLSSLDDKIDLLHRENKTLEAMAETLFRQWFVEEAKDEWEDAKLGEVVTITYGKNLPIKKLLKSGYPVFGGNGQIGFYNKYLYVEPQVLVSCRGEASGKVNISLPRSFITNNSLILVRDKRKEITFEYLKYHSLNYDFTLHISGSAQPQITIDNLYDAAFLIPPVDLINKFTEVVRGCEEKRANNLKQIHTLEKLRDTLLPKLMSGEVRVKYEEEEMASCSA